MKKKIIIIIVIFGIILVGCELFRNKRNNSEITISQDSSDLIEKTEEIVEENNNLIETKEEKKEDIDIKMTAIGDIMCHNTQYNDAYLADSKTYDFSYVFTDIEKYINSADIAVGNLETTFAGKERGYSSYPRFNTPEQLATNLKKLGIDVVSTANNHCMDTNYSGLVSTLKYLDEAEIAHTGTNESEESQNKILIQDVKGIKIAFLSFTYGTNGISIPSDKKYAVNLIDDELIIKQLQLAKEQNIVKVESKQNGVVFTFDSSENIKYDIAELVRKYGNKIKFSAGIKPMITYKTDNVKEQELLKQIKEFLEIN